MSTLYYLDTSALVKLFIKDGDEALFAHSENCLIVWELAVVDLYSTVARKVRTGEINEVGKFRSDIPIQSLQS